MKNPSFWQVSYYVQDKQLKTLVRLMPSISVGFQTAVYILEPLWVSTVFGSGPEFCEQSGICNGLMMEQHF